MIVICTWEGRRPKSELPLSEQRESSLTELATDEKMRLTMAVELA